MLVVGPATAVEVSLEAPGRGGAPAGRWAGAKPRVAASVVAELTGASANALYRALTSAE